MDIGKTFHNFVFEGHEANINSLQELAQELRMETEKIMGERARIKDIVTNKGLYAAPLTMKNKSLTTK